MSYLSYLFSPIPGPEFSFINILLIYCGVLIVFGILLKIFFLLKKEHKALKRTLKPVPSQFIWSGVIIGILALCRTHGVPYLSMRFILFIFVGLSLFYIGKSIYRIIKVYPEMKKVVEKPVHKEEKAVYTTKKKK